MPVGTEMGTETALIRRGLCGTYPLYLVDITNIIDMYESCIHAFVNAICRRVWKPSRYVRTWVQPASKTRGAQCMHKI